MRFPVFHQFLKYSDKLVTFKLKSSFFPIIMFSLNYSKLSNCCSKRRILVFQLDSFPASAHATCWCGPCHSTSTQAVPNPLISVWMCMYLRVGVCKYGSSVNVFNYSSWHVKKNASSMHFQQGILPHWLRSPFVLVTR